MSGTDARFVLGAMSGTSADGVDVVVLALDEAARPRVCAHHHAPYDADLRAAVLALNTPGADEIDRAARAANAVAAVYVHAIEALRAASPEAARARIVGVHGQTVRHRPGADAHGGYTVQLINAALVADRTGLDVVADFRSADVAAGGQGAPLVPAFHAACFDRPGLPQAILNLGGIANVTLLEGRPGAAVRGFDTGPANALLDAWAQRHTGTAIDVDGRFAAAGKVDAALLTLLRAEPYFALPAPKSTGRDLFDLPWLDARLAACPAPSAGRAAENVQATLVALSATTAADALAAALPSCRRVAVCGGGARNPVLMAALGEALRARLPDCTLETTDALGLPAMQVEAAAFAWLADAFTRRRAGQRVEVTGARTPRVLGALHIGAVPDA